MIRFSTLPKKPLVSILTPTFNAGQYLEECIKSILEQDYQNIEHVIQDGDSNDNTKKILQKYRNTKYKNRIKIYSEPDNGQIDGLNKAIQKSKGEILLVLNADDMLMPYAVSWGVENLKKYPTTGVIYGDVYVINKKSEIIDIYKAHEYSFEKLLSIELVPPAQASFIRREALQKVGFYADISLDTCPDFEMWIRIGQKFLMKHVWGVVTKYRYHEIPQLDSKEQRTVERFVTAKKIAMDRLFNDPKTPESIKKLKRRAYAGLNFWASYTAYSLGQPKQAFSLLIKSFVAIPSRSKLWKIFKELKAFIKYRLSLLGGLLKHAF